MNRGSETKTIALENGLTTTTLRDAAQRVFSHSTAAGSTVKSSVAHGYDAAGRRTYASYEDALGQAYDYDNAGQVKNVIVNTANPATVNPTASPTHAYNYDPAGNRTSSLDSGITTTYAASSVNAYTNINSTPISHDANGNMLTSTGSAAVPAASYAYDRENRLRTITQNGTVTGYTYDALSRCIESFNNTSPTDNRERYTWSGWTLLTREIFTGTTPTSSFRYTWGLDLSESLEGAGGVGGLLAIERIVVSNTDIRFPHYDANGNIIALTDSTGNVSARYRYDAFGKILSTTDLDSSDWVTHNIHGFSTKPAFGNQGLLYYGYRFYTPSTGRWINRDPIEESGGINLYGFIGNDALNVFDFLGFIGAQITVKAELGGKGQNAFSVHWSEKRTEGGSCEQYAMTSVGYICIRYSPTRVYWDYKKEDIEFQVNGYGEASLWIDCDKEAVKDGQPAKITGLTTKIRNFTVGRFQFEKEEVLENPTFSIGQEKWSKDGNKKSVKIPWSMWATVKVKASISVRSVESDWIQNLAFTTGDTKQAIIKRSGILHYDCCKKNIANVVDQKSE